MITAKEALKLAEKDYSKGYLEILENKIRYAAKLSYHEVSYGFLQKVNKLTLSTIKEKLEDNGFEVSFIEETYFNPFGAIMIKW